MLLILSPAKALDFESPAPIKKHSNIHFKKEASELVSVLQGFSPSDLSKLMGISNNLAELNFERYHNWEKEFNTKNSKQALFAFNGEVYNGLKASTLNNESVQFAQDHVRILSGLFGILKPLDLIQPYRLEMGTKLNTGNHESLYSFWGDKIKTQLEKTLEQTKGDTLINLASNEYSKSAKINKLKYRVITPQFKELKDDSYKTITIYAKKARGLMTRYIVENKITSAEDIKHFEEEGYFYNETLSSKNNWVFTR